MLHKQDIVVDGETVTRFYAAEPFVVDGIVYKPPNLTRYRKKPMISIKSQNILHSGENIHIRPSDPYSHY